MTRCAGDGQRRYELRYCGPTVRITYEKRAVGETKLPKSERMAAVDVYEDSGAQLIQSQRQGIRFKSFDVKFEVRKKAHLCSGLCEGVVVAHSSPHFNLAALNPLPIIGLSILTQEAGNAPATSLDCECSWATVTTYSDGATRKREEDDKELRGRRVEGKRKLRKSDI
ncbi:hypothetical protein EVAR_693_1 [Eumeta japonica]|uniref:Uncharacterized protein n=1 Tax=Eumeta variegata TaxID=151549 RepID=A0A4C1SBI6_EUMVA|nr:hypothetical protein EVAR_693_1 [Eumeta japonica]